MAKVTGLGMARYFAGLDISGDVQAFDEISGAVATFDQTGIDKSAHERAPGLRDGKISSSGFFNPARAHTKFGPLVLADVQDMITLGSLVGSDCAMMTAKQLNYAPTRSDSGELTTKVEADANGLGLEWGNLLTPGVRTDTTATNGASFDTAASASFGGQAYLQVTALTGTNVVLTIQDSADNSSFTAVAGFAFASATSAPNTQRLQLGGTATLRRYLRVVSSGTFASASFVVGVVKNQVATTF